MARTNTHPCAAAVTPTRHRRRPPDAALSARVAQLRAATGCTQAEMAAMANVTNPVIMRVERAEVTPDLTTALGIARAFGVSVDWLATGRGPIFAETPPGVVALAKPIDNRAARAAIQLIEGSSESLTFALLESTPGHEAVPPLVGGVFWQPNWLAGSRCGLIIPRSLSAYETVSWLGAWISAGHVWRGAFTLPDRLAAELANWSPGFLAEAQVSRDAGQWLGSLATRLPDRVEFPEIEQMRAMLPAAQVERLEIAARALKDGGTERSDACELVSLIQRHPELAPRLFELTRWLLPDAYHEK